MLKGVKEVLSCVRVTDELGESCKASRMSRHGDVHAVTFVVALVGNPLFKSTTSGDPSAQHRKGINT